MTTDPHFSINEFHQFEFNNPTKELIEQWKMDIKVKANTEQRINSFDSLQTKGFNEFLLDAIQLVEKINKEK